METRVPSREKAASIVNRNSDVIKVLSLHPSVGERCLRHISACRQRKIIIGIAQAYRGRKEQEALWFKGRDANGAIVNWREVVTHAPPGWSFHEYGLAYDIVLLRRAASGMDEVVWDVMADLNLDHIADYLQIGAAGEEVGMVWGGRWPRRKQDMPHFEFHPRLSIEECVSKFGTIRRVPDEYFNVVNGANVGVA